MDFVNSIEFALMMDSRDPLKDFRERFYLPLRKDSDQPVLYFTGNSLGLQPKSVSSYINEELEKWKNLGVDGHFQGDRPWLYYHKFFKEPLAQIVGANPEEVVSMNNLTANIHFLLASFYRPTKEKYKIIMEAGAFPSDQYAVETHVKSRGFDPEDAIIEVTPSSGNGNYISLDDISTAIADNRSATALLFFSGVHYYTGQWFQIREIVKMAHQEGILAGFDLAHAAGNVPLTLHEDQVDFATWCSYKYLNSGPGNVSGIFIHEDHGRNVNIPRFGGWWGHDEESRFSMQKGFNPMPGADGWQVSNVNILSSAAHLASLEIFMEAGMGPLRSKSELLTGYLQFIIDQVAGGKIETITPSTPHERGCQLSLDMKENGKMVFDRLNKMGVVVDWREPNVIRVAPVPLYNSFEDIYLFGECLKKFLEIA